MFMKSNRITRVPQIHRLAPGTLFSYFTGFEVGFHFILFVSHQTASENQREINHNATVVENILLHFFSQKTVS